MKNKNPFLSVVIPCYNEATYIGILLKGLASQTYPNFEIVISNANSTDNTIEVIESFNLPNLKIVSSEAKGPGYQRNFGVKHTKGEWLLFFDADVILPDKDFIKKLFLTTMENNWMTASARFKVKDTSLIERIGTRIDYDYLKFLSHTRYPVAPGWCILTKKELFETNKGFNEKIYFGEDYDYVSRVGRKSFGFVEAACYYINLRRVHEDGLAFIYKSIANEVYRHTHHYNLEKSPYSYGFGKHK